MTVDEISFVTKTDYLISKFVEDYLRKQERTTECCLFEQNEGASQITYQIS